jgi:Tfp pilus assembly protein PilF
MFRPLIATVVLLAGASSLGAQDGELRATNAVRRDAVLCPALAAPSTPNGADSRTADSLLVVGSRAAILGDHALARDLLTRAVVLDPGNPVAAYRLARTMDDSGEYQAAALEYCRFLRVASSAPEAREVMQRLRDLLEGGSAPDLRAWTLYMAAGAEAYASGDGTAAAEAFSRAVALQPEWPDAYHERAIANLTLGETEHALADLERYLALAPRGPMADDAALRLEELRRPQGPLMAAVPRLEPRSVSPPERVLVQGLLLPGLGQHVTGRSLLGVTILGGVGGALWYGTRDQIVVRTQGARDPFGNYYEYEVSARERPHLLHGIGIAVALAAGGALEAYLHARRGRTR